MASTRSGGGLSDEFHQPRAHLEPDVVALAPAPTDDPADLTPTLRRAGRQGILQPIRERVAAVTADTDVGIALGHRRGDHLLGEFRRSLWFVGRSQPVPGSVRG